MELRKSWRSWDFRKIFTLVYVVSFALYLVVGLSPAWAEDYEAATDIKIAKIGLISDVVTLHLNDDKLDTPSTIAGRYSANPHKTLLIGHSTTVFQNLKFLEVGDEIDYDELTYKVVKVETLAKAEINMRKVLASAEEETIILMTCAGESLGGGDATHRLMVTAVSE